MGFVVLALLATLLLALPASAAACGEEGTEDTAPLISSAKVTPASLPAEGGTATISARVEDDCGLQQVYAEIYSGEGIYQSFQMLPAEDINTHSAVYRAEFQVLANSQESPVSYQANILATDTNGAFAETFAGEVEVAGVPQFDEAPYVYEPSVASSVLGGFGGMVKIGTSASDNRGVASAHAIVTYPDNSEEEVWLEPVSFSRFEGSLKVPANPGGEPQTYSVAVFAEDDIGQTTGAYAGTVTVEPKGTPSPGVLSLVDPSDQHFGPVTIGEEGSREIVLVNTGKPGSPPVSGFLRSSGSPFSLPGATPEGVPFTLQAGEQQVFEVDFAPSARGQQLGRVTVIRSDGRQPKLGVSLFGWGTKQP
jgi:hypothetical protein